MISFVNGNYLHFSKPNPPQVQTTTDEMTSKEKTTRNSLVYKGFQTAGFLLVSTYLIVVRGPSGYFFV